jgi:hypothetical protein
MCSGCSGDYAGGFEELGDPVNQASSSDEPAGWDRSKKEDGNRLSSERVRGFEDSPSAQWSSQRSNLLGSIRENGAESYEIQIQMRNMCAFWRRRRVTFFPRKTRRSLRRSAS